MTSAHNLLGAILDNHVYVDNPLRVDQRRVLWRRVLDVNDRALRNIIIGLGGRSPVSAWLLSPMTVRACLGSRQAERWPADRNVLPSQPDQRQDRECPGETAADIFQSRSDLLMERWGRVRRRSRCCAWQASILHRKAGGPLHPDADY